MLLAMIFLHFFANFIKMCSPPRQEAYFRKTIFANIVCKTDFPCLEWLQNHHFGGSISVLCCSKNNSFCRLSGKWPSCEALFSVTWIVACFLDYIFINFFIFFQKCAPCPGSKHDFQDRPTTLCNKNATFWSHDALNFEWLKSSFWSFSLLCSFRSLSVPQGEPQKVQQKCVLLLQGASLRFPLAHLNLNSFRLPPIIANCQ